MHRVTIRLMHYIRLVAIVFVFVVIQRSLVVLAEMDWASASLVAVLAVAVSIGVTKYD